MDNFQELQNVQDLTDEGEDPLQEHLEIEKRIRAADPNYGRVEIEPVGIRGAGAIVKSLMEEAAESGIPHGAITAISKALVERPGGAVHENATRAIQRLSDQQKGNLVKTLQNFLEPDKSGNGANGSDWLSRNGEVKGFNGTLLQQLYIDLKGTKLPDNKPEKKK